MWCASCQEDVATEISEDGQSLKCVACGDHVRQVFAPSLHPETKSARDLLQKWAAEQQQQLARQQQGSAFVEAILPPVLDSESPEKSNEKVRLDKVGGGGWGSSTDENSTVEEAAGSVSSISPDTEPVQVETTASPVKNLHETANDMLPGQAGDANNRVSQKPQADSQEVLDKKRPKYRIDTAHPATRPGTELAAPAGEPPVKTVSAKSGLKDRAESDAEVDQTSVPKTVVEPSRGESVRQAYISHVPHDEAPSPHFDVAAISKRAKSRPGRAEAIWGQLMAYAGVGILTVGTVFVLWGYFGMIESYASTGWLLSTAGQMLLLLGIVTLVSGGMQQTTHEVTERIEYLGGRMIRIEKSTDQLLHGPHFHQGDKQRGGLESAERESSAA